MPSPDLPHFNIDLTADRRDTARAFAWVAGAIILALAFGAVVWFALDRAVPVAPIMGVRP